MKFEDEMINAEFYTDYKSLTESKKKILESSFISEFRQEMFDLYDVEDIFVVGDFLLREGLNFKPTLFFNIKNSTFIEFLDRREDFINNLIIICEVQGSCYCVTCDNITECESPDIRVQLPNEKYH